jgi:hypothetical protein
MCSAPLPPAGSARSQLACQADHSKGLGFRWPTNPPLRRPLLLLGAELDGQMRWPTNSPYAADAALLATKTTPE